LFSVRCFAILPVIGDKDSCFFAYLFTQQLNIGGVSR
jgi:hypothetical protein